MATIRSMLPAVAQPYTEALVGAALGALVGGYVVKRKGAAGALVGAIAGFGVALTRKGGTFPFAAGEFAGLEEIIEELPGGVEEEVIIPEWQRDWRRHSWDRHRHSGFGWQGRHHGGHHW